MQISSLLKLLNDFSGVVKEAGNVALAEDLGDLQSLFSDQKSQTTAKFLGTLRKRRPLGDHGTESQAIRQVCIALQGLKRILGSAKSKSAESDIDLLINFIEGCSHPTIAQLVAEAKDWTTPSRTRRPRPGATKVTPADVIAKYLNELDALESDNRHFDDVILRLKEDRLVSAQAMREIASQYTGITLAKKKTKKEALQAIADRQAISARQAARAPHQM